MIENPQPLLPSSGINQILENIYGALFTPQLTFANLRSQPSVLSGMIVVALVNILESVRTEQSVALTFGAVIWALIGWLFFSSLLKVMAEIFQHPVDLKVLLTLTGFGSIPWIFMAPALSLGGELGSALGLVVMIWFTVWQIWAASVAIAVTAQQLVKLIPMTLVGALVSVIWIFNSIKLVSSL